MTHPRCNACLNIIDKRTCLHPESPHNKRFVTPAQCAACAVRVTDPDYNPYRHKIGLPPLRRRLKNFVHSMWKFMMSGFKFASKAEQQKRLNICNGCDYRRGNRCLKCGCGLKAKIAMKVMECPEGFW